MKYAFIASDFMPRVGGISQFIYGLLSQLPPDQVVAIAPPTSGWELFDAQQRFPVHRFLTQKRWAYSVRNTKWMLPQFLFQLRKLPQVDLVVCGHGTLSLLLAAYLNKRSRGTPFGVFLHGLDFLGVYGRPQWPIYKWLLQSADMVFPNSSMMKTAVQQSTNLPPNKLHLLHPSIIESELQVTVPADVLRQELGLENNFVLLTVARLTRAKGLDTVIQALPEVLAAIPQAHYVVLGDGPARLELEALAEAHKVHPNISFLGAKAHAEVANFLAMSDLFVMTPHENPDTVNVESFGIVYLEANYLKRPVVASAAGGIPDAVKHDETGLLVTPGRPAELAQAVIRLWQDEALAQRLVAHGYKRVLQQFTSTAVARQFEQRVAYGLKRLND
ncbi:glycosyltransferase family 4 protein [Candidatus Leptofilum sp.]|uniref:glycosyltransferase family 4 protein n=1 Tax=Candidatus Leptofilum sp. TaxID=3241576 RepID=UPI003B592E6A